MSQTIDIFIGPADPAGEVSLVYLHTEAIDLDRFGSKLAPRVSDVEFDPANQEWVARLLSGEEIARHKSRNFVLAEERRVIDERFARGEEIPSE